MKKEHKSQFLIVLFVTFAFLSLYAVGIIGPTVSLVKFWSVYILIIVSVNVAVLVALRFLSQNKRAIFQRTIIIFMSFYIILSLLDIILHPILLNRLCFRTPDDMFLIRRWPTMPLIWRYTPNSSYEGRIFGCLPDRKGPFEYRYIKFQTDTFGFRNNKASKESDFDILVLGDSFLFGSGNSQEKILPSILASRYGFETYNLSMSGASLWHEFINLAVEFKRLKTHENTIVLWGIFPGNDLDEPYGPTLEIAKLPWNNRLGRLRSSISNFRDRSPLALLFRQAFLSQRRDNSITIMKEFLNGQKILFYRPYYERSKYSYNQILTHPNYKSLEATIAAMKKFADTNKLIVKIVFIPSMEEVYSWVLESSDPWSSSTKPNGFSIAFKELCQKYDLEFLDLKPFLIRESKRVFEDYGELLYWCDDTHWNDKGHEVVTSIIYNELLIPGKKLQSTQLQVSEKTKSF